MNMLTNNNYILRKQEWEDHQDHITEAEVETMLKQLNKLHNRKGYTLADYQNGIHENYY